MKYVRIFCGHEGLTHFEEGETEMAETNFAPPAPPFLMTSVFPTDGIRFGTMPPGWYGEWHPSPQRQFRVQLVGEVEFDRIVGGYYQRFGKGGTTRDFISFAERSSSHDLSGFFGDWLLSTRWVDVVGSGTSTADLAGHYR